MVIERPRPAERIAHRSHLRRKAAAMRPQAQNQYNRQPTRRAISRATWRTIAGMCLFGGGLVSGVLFSIAQWYAVRQ